MHGRIESTAPWIALAVAGFLATASNGAFWRGLIRAAPIDSPANALSLAVTFLLLVAVFQLLLLLVAFRWLFKPVLIAALLVAAVSAHFMGAYGIVIDREMIRNMAQTDPAEVRDLLGAGFAVDLIVLGILPALLVARAPLRFARLRRELVKRFAFGGASLLVCTGLVFADFKQLAYVGREHGHLRELINPAAPIHAALRYTLAARRGPEPELRRIGEDATRLASGPRDRASLVVLVVGETARAANFSLNGYARETNPRLAALPVISFTRVRSCGTATAVSLPCMFSPGGRKAYDAGVVEHQEGLLDVLQRAGVRALWRENNSGCKGTCDRVPSESREQLAIPGLCDGAECFDEVLLEGLQGVIDGLDGDALIVLHQQGSHGPAYHRRSPPARKKFSPECSGAELQDCSRESIVNAYDNSILYTDWFLGHLIELLEANTQRFDTAMLYLSDHGESLGENGIYLHGFPWLIAPDEQTRVPMILWLSDPARAGLGIDPACLERSRHAPLSHDALFHSLLGVFDVSTALYRPELDLFAPCRHGRPEVASETHEASPG